MDRRTALTTAGTVSVVVVAAATAIAANVGILRGTNASTSVGKLTPVAEHPVSTSPTAEPEVVTVYQDEVVKAPSPPPSVVSDAGATDPASVSDASSGDEVDQSDDDATVSTAPDAESEDDHGSVEPEDDHSGSDSGSDDAGRGEDD